VTFVVHIMLAISHYVSNKPLSKEPKNKNTIEGHNDFSSLAFF